MKKRYFGNSFPLYFLFIFFPVFLPGIDSAMGQPLPVPISLHSASATYDAGQSFEVTVKIGNPDSLVHDLFGVSFKLNYPQSDFLEPVKTPLVEIGDFWSQDAFLFARLDSMISQISVAITEKSGASGRNGTGIVAKLQFRTTTETPDQTTLRFGISDIVAITSTKDTLVLRPWDLVVTIIQPPFFEVSISPDEHTITAGVNTEFTITLENTQNLRKKAGLRVWCVPEGLTLQQSLDSLETGSSANIRIQTSRQTAAGNYQIIAEAQTAALTQLDTARITILPYPSFKYVVIPKHQTVIQGDTVRYVMKLDSVVNFTGRVNFVSIISPGNRNFGIQFIPGDISIGDSARMLIATESVDPGHYENMMIAVSGELADTTMVNFDILPKPDFTLEIQPKVLTTHPNATINFKVYASFLHGFDTPIQLAVNGLPTEISAVFDSPVLNQTDSTGLQLIIPENMPPGTYPFQVTATGGGLSRSDSASVIIKEPASFQLIASPDSQAIMAGDTTQYKIFLQTDTHFFEAVQLQLSDTATAPGEVSISPTSITRADTAVLEIQTPIDIPSKVYEFVIIGKSDQQTDSVTVKLTILNPPDFLLLVSPAFQEITLNETAKFNISIQPLETFNEKIQLSYDSELTHARFSLSKTSIFPSDTASLSIQLSNTIDPGEYSIRIIARLRNLERQQQVILKINFTCWIKPVPNVFTPNGDGWNDDVDFYIEGFEQGATVMIFNFRGKKVRMLTNKRYWDGTDDSGELLPPGIYLYMIKINSQLEKKGTITLVR